MSVAGLDIGTSGCKIVVYDLEGNVKAACSHAYKEEGADGYREIDPATVLSGVKACIKNVSKQLNEPIEALAVGTLGESVVCIDGDGMALGKSMVTGDKRGIPEVEEILQKASKEEIMAITGIPASEMYSLPKLLWMNKHTDTLRKARYVFTYEDYIGYCLTGNRKISYSSASRTMALDIEKKVWSSKLLEIAGISEKQMSLPVSAGTIVGRVLPEVAEELGLSAGMQVVAGGHDQECAALGAGVVTPGIGEDGHGTCEVLNLMLNEPLRTSSMMETDLACIPGMIPGTYMTNLEITTCGILMNWSRDCIFEGIHRRCREKGEDFFAYMDRKATGLKTELLVLPQFGSSGHPDINYDMKGTIWGLTIHTKPEEIYLAVKESLAFQMKMAYEYAGFLNIDVKQIAITGGGAVSGLTMQIRSDVFGVKTVSLKNREAGTLGCMIAAATAMGHYSCFEEGVKRAVKILRTYRPREEWKEYYQSKYERYKRLYHKMHDFM